MAGGAGAGFLRAGQPATLPATLPPRDPSRATRILGILNLTPDSFSDGGVDRSPEDSLRRARKMVDEGADALDLGAESSRPGAAEVSAAEEWDRLLPVLAGARALGIPVSVDTVKASVAKRALDAGATMINDISAMTRDPEMAGVVADAACPVVLMHMRGTPADMQERAVYGDVVAESLRELDTAMSRALSSGVREENILIDPGLGFAKTAGHNLSILQRLREYTTLGRPLVVGASRKSFLGRITGDTQESREDATLAVSALAVAGGASVLRVHEVGRNVRAALTAEAVHSGRLPGEGCPC
ncbi:MAG: dihydropteroate synthase [Gemmatimonadota bacterium]|nr:dihydropteroate synthase [Gemmatimonadota bacterium]MDP6460255.1 dihydropteroate synthase [Gemmatimonadota bacterium]MDP6530119.1 dihydropteroate synthase [Gemmatimonadota bacterium]MDP6801953.1 dihydropteroate synthase [Gemmatimonadota bacterium]MDP7031301.1 dihydropteroate synthase [Gemmatimonadota bacterium]